MTDDAPVNTVPTSAPPVRMTTAEFEQLFVARVGGDDATVWACAVALGEAQRARDSEESMAEVLKGLEWRDEGECGGFWCPTCGQESTRGAHAPNCAIDAALRPFR